MTDPKQFDGSRRHILDWIESPTFLDTVQEWIAPDGMNVDATSTRMPMGWDQPGESRLFDSRSPFLHGALKEQMKRWWLAHPGNIPNWDLIIQAKSIEGPALVLVEAKAHLGELDREAKLQALRDDPDAQARTGDNHLHIQRAIAEAADALSRTDRSIAISIDRHYQLSNRIAMAWKLASLGIPTTLVFLGFTGDREICAEGSYFADDDHWRAGFTDYIKGIFPAELLDAHIFCGTSSFRLLSRSLPVIRHSRPIAERRAARRPLRPNPVPIDQ